MYSAYKLNKQGDNIQPWHTLFPIWNQSVVPCPVLTVASWPAYRFPQEAGQVVWYSHLFQNFPQFILIHKVRGFGIVNKAEVYWVLGGNGWMSMLYWTPGTVIGMAWSLSLSFPLWRFPVISTHDLSSRVARLLTRHLRTFRSPEDSSGLTKTGASSPF